MAAAELGVRRVYAINYIFECVYFILLMSILKYGLLSIVGEPISLITKTTGLALISRQSIFPHQMDV